MKLSNKWKNIIILLSSYLGSITFLILGGYIWKNGDEKNKTHIKNVFILHLTILFINMFLLFFDLTLFSIFNISYSSGFYDFWRIFKSIISLSILITYVVLIIIELIKPNEINLKVQSQKAPKAPKKIESKSTHKEQNIENIKE